MKKRELREKVVMLSMWDCEDEKSWPYQNYYLNLKKLVGKVILFDPRKNRFLKGPEGMRSSFLETIRENKPDFVFMMIGSNELNIDTLEEINKISPQTKTVVDFGDDDIDFEIFSRYYAMFVDYYLIGQPQYISNYKKEGLKRAFTRLATNTEHYRPLKLKKKYDMTFIGTPLPSRIDFLKFLIKEGFDVKLFGRKWGDVKEVKSIYQGEVSNEESLNIRNQSKINLCFSRNQFGEPHFVLRAFNIAACKAFQVVDYFPDYRQYFDEDKEIVMFKDKKELAKKLRYYLKHDKEREKVADKAYRKVVKKYTMFAALKDLFDSALKEESSFQRYKIPELKKKIVNVTNENIDSISSDLDKVDYISFIEEGSKAHKYKNYLQARGLEKTGKEISCCDYSVSASGVGEIVVFKTVRSMNNFDKADFNSLLNINQILVTKSFFLKNKEKFKEILSGKKEIDFVNGKNIGFVAIPLVSISGFPSKTRNLLSKFNNEQIEKAFQLNFAVELFSLIKRKKALFDSYSYKLILNSLLSNSFILNYLLRARKSEEKRKRLKE